MFSIHFKSLTYLIEYDTTYACSYQFTELIRESMNKFEKRNLGENRH